MSRVAKVMNETLFDAKMDQSGWKGIVVLSAENVFYLSGSPTVLRLNEFQQTRPNSPRLVIVVQPRDDEPTLISPALDQKVNEEGAWAKDVRGYQEYSVSPIEMLAQVMRDRGLGKGPVGLDMAAMGVPQYRHLVKLLPDVSFEDCGPLMAQVRSVKTAEEIAFIKEASDRMDAAFLETFTSSHIGDTETELHRRMMMNLTDQGLDRLSGWTLIGEEAAEVHRPLSQERSLKPGDIVRTDYTAAFNEYKANLSRMAVAGAATAEQRESYQALLEVEEGMAEFVEPGVHACDLYNYCHEWILERGHEHTLSLAGHSIGLNLHDDPMIVISDETELQTNMVIVLEPVIGPYYHIQDQIVITDKGSRLLSDQFDTKEIFIIN